MASQILHTSIPVERHPLEPFLPSHAGRLILGSFPPKHERWSMEFFYPNFQNDMWRIMGLVFFGDKLHFVDQSPETVQGKIRRFDQEKVERFCRENGLALYDTARAVRRLKENASDKFLEIVEPTDIPALLNALPQCHTVITTGQKATDTLVAVMQCREPEVGNYTTFTYNSRTFRFYRMPSSSRAYPLAVEKKAELYKNALL